MSSELGTAMNCNVALVDFNGVRHIIGACTGMLVSILWGPGLVEPDWAVESTAGASSCISVSLMVIGVFGKVKPSSEDGAVVVM